MGVVKSVNPFALSMGMGINCGLAGLTFFGTSISNPPVAVSGQAFGQLISRNARVPR